ncbi:MAG: bacterioferritin [Bryobacterales bacterium]|nr:bacterioferritin [Bryobacterales bacterium]
MKGNDGVIRFLNEVLKAELTAINQYFLHGKMCQNWGYLRLAAYNRAESIDEMKHADLLIDRILFLEGTPNMSDMFPINVGPNVKAQIQNDLALELQALPRLNAAIRLSSEVGDNASRELFEEILAEEEHHVDWLEAQLHMMDEIGVENYLAQQMHKGS